MAHYAFLDENSIVTEVIVGIDETELIEGLDPETWYGNFRNQVCKRTSYNTFRGQHKNGGTPFRGNYAGINMIYIEDLDIFIEQQPYPSWILNEQEYIWEAPILQPAFNPENPKFYEWNEEILNWEEIQVSE